MSSSDATSVPSLLAASSLASTNAGPSGPAVRYATPLEGSPTSSHDFGMMGVISSGALTLSGVLAPLFYCAPAAVILPYFSTTAATFLASSSASTLVAASA